MYRGTTMRISSQIQYISYKNPSLPFCTGLVRLIYASRAKVNVFVRSTHTTSRGKLPDADHTTRSATSLEQRPTYAQLRDGHGASSIGSQRCLRLAQGAFVWLTVTNLNQRFCNCAFVWLMGALVWLTMQNPMPFTVLKVQSSLAQG